MKRQRVSLLFGLLAIMLPALAEIQSITVRFDQGVSSTTLSGSLKGDQVVDYVLRARVGQTMHMVFSPSSTYVYFNVLPPGSQDESIFIGSSQGNEWRGALPASGDYRLRTHLMRSAARHNESSSYTLTVGITAVRASHSLRADQGAFDATGVVPCARYRGQPMGSCTCGVARDPGGNASVKVTFGDGHTRFIVFNNGQATGTDLSQADGDMRFSASKEVDLFMIRAGQERYEISEAVVVVG